jgi:hypothetical protein
MYWYSKLLWATVAICAISACQKPTPVDQLVDTSYFNMDSLVNAQIHILINSGAQLEKKVGMGRETETIRLTPDSSAWAWELGLFTKANIDKPVLWGKYTEMPMENDPYSNLKLTRYEPKKAEAPGVSYLHLYYLHHRAQLKKIVTSFQEKNLLFETSTQLEMEFEDNHGVPVLATFRTQGYQKMRTQDTVRYEISGRILYP